MADIEYTPAPIVSEFIQDYRPGELFYSFIVGPFGCLAGDTLVLTELGAIPISDIDRPMRVLSWNEKTRQFQLSLSSGAYPKGRDCLYRVTTPEGVFDASGEHQLLCADGKYRQVAELCAGDLIAGSFDARLQTTEELSRSGLLSGARRYSQKHEDSLARYAASARLYGQQFLREGENDQCGAQELSDVRESSGLFFPAGAAHTGDPLERTPPHIHQELFDDRLQRLHSLTLLATRAEGAEGSGEGEFFARVEGSDLELRQSRSSLETHRPERQHGEHFLQIGGCEAYQAPSLSVSNRAIVSIERLNVKQAYWDMHVHDTHNYITVDGAIHHNSAKTTGSLMKIVYMAGLQAKSPIDGIRRTRCVVVRNTMPQLKDNTLVSWNYWFKDGVAGKWKATEKNFMLKFGDVECEVLFRALDTPDDISRVLGLEITFAVLDEFVQIPFEIREGLSGRCGRYPPRLEGGATNFGIWGASNPGEEDTPWHKFVVEECPENVKYFHQPSGLSPEAENIENLPPNYYKNLAMGKSPSWIKQFIEAEWGFSVAGKPVIPTFNRDLHVSKQHLIPNQYTPLIIGYDPGMHSALIFGQPDSYGRLLILDELILDGYGAQRMCTDRLLPLLNMKYRGFEVIIAPDPACQSRTQTNESSVLDVLKEARFKKYWSVKVGPTNLIAPRLAAIEGFTTRLTEKGPAMLIDPRCRVIIKALASGWRYEKTQKGNEKEVPEKNMSSHPGDALTYLAQYCTENTARTARRNQAPVIPRTFTNAYNMR